MKYVLFTLLLIGLVGCDSRSPKRNAEQSGKTDVESGRTYRETGLEGVYLVDTSSAQSVLDNYGMKHDLLVEILSDKPLRLSIAPVDENRRTLFMGSHPESTSYQYFILLTHSKAAQSGSEVEWKVTFRSIPSDKTSLSAALAMTPNEHIQGNTSYSTTFEGSITIPPVSTGLIPPGSQVLSNNVVNTNQELKDQGCVSIWRYQRLILPLHPSKGGDSRLFKEPQTLLSLDIWDTQAYVPTRAEIIESQQELLRTLDSK